MNSWWDLGEWSGNSGTELSLYDVTCAFCGVKNNFKLHSSLKRANAKKKVLNYEIFQCENCANFSMIFWSAGSSLHGKCILPWPLRHEKHPDSWPDDVGRYWLQAKRAQADGNWDAAAVMARSALQLALRSKEAKGKDLYHEIDDLAAKAILPPIMKEWSHEIRMLARDPAHPTPGDEGTSPQQVHDIVQFLDFLLEYLFTCRRGYNISEVALNEIDHNTI